MSLNPGRPNSSENVSDLHPVETASRGKCPVCGTAQDDVQSHAMAEHVAVLTVAIEWLNKHASAIQQIARQPKCTCWTCTETRRVDFTIERVMITCPDCGNKRCPKATHHDNACTGSNEPGQVGSRYGRLA